MVNLKDNIWIEGFGTKRKMVIELSKGAHIDTPIVYFGKTSDIPEEIAKKCVELTSTGLYKSYIWNDDKVEEYGIQPLSNTAKESVQSACNREYCIVFKK